MRSHIGTETPENITWEIFPKNQSEFILYEDDGESYNYLNGEIVKTVEKTLERGDLEQLAPGLMDYLLVLRQKGLAGIESRDGRYYYPVWFYRAVRL